MIRDLTVKPIYSSFLSCDKDIQKILQTLFVYSKPYSDILKRLLIINNKDCLDLDNSKYQAIVDQYSVADMIEKGYIRLNSKIGRGTHEEIKSYMLITLDNFIPNKKNLQYRDYNILFDIVCYNDAWVLDDYKIRPLLICGYIDGILNSATTQNRKKQLQSNIKLTGIGQYSFIGCNNNNLNQDLSVYTIGYHGVHFTEDMQNIETVLTS